MNIFFFWQKNIFNLSAFHKTLSYINVTNHKVQKHFHYTYIIPENRNKNSMKNITECSTWQVTAILSSSDGQDIIDNEYG